MKKLALAFLIASTAAGTGRALSGIFQISPTYYTQGSVVTVRLEVDSAVGATAVTPSAIVFTGGAGLVYLSGPVPAAQDVPAPYREFTWTYSAVACGTANLSASATGTESGASASTGTVVFNNLTVLCPGTPTPSPTVSPTPTETPWIIYGTATPAPLEGNAAALGNLFHPLMGQACVLQVDLPYPSLVRIDIYDRVGDKIRSMERQAPAGRMLERWDGRNSQGSVVGSGIYAAQVRAKGVVKTLKMVVIK